MPKKGLFVANTFLGLGEAVVNDAKLFTEKLRGYSSRILINPSTKEMLSALIMLISNPNNEVVFGVFSHGQQVRDISGDEPDGMDECIVMKDGLLIDDLLTDLINKYRKCDRLTLIADICHSGVYDFKDFVNRKNLTVITSCADRETSKQLVKNGCFTMQFWNCFKDGVLNIRELKRRLDLYNQTPQICVDGRCYNRCDYVTITL
jgi:hypothetical protein